MVRQGCQSDRFDGVKEEVGDVRRVSGGRKERRRRVMGDAKVGIISESVEFSRGGGGGDGLSGCWIEG